MESPAVSAGCPQISATDRRAAAAIGTLGVVSSVAQYLRANSGVLPHTAFDHAGFSRADVEAAVRRGSILRVRNGWFAVPGAHPDLIRAVRVGGVATAASVARMHRLWLLDDGMLHVRVRSSTGRLSAPHDRRLPVDRVKHRVCLHYRSRGGFDRARDPLTAALAEMFTCTDASSALVTIDSALERQELDLGHLDRVREWMPKTRRHLIDRVDPESQSGLETMIRLLLRSKRIPHRVQVEIDGVGRVDVLVGDRLVIELDGKAFHTGEAFEEDRRRDFELVTRGYVVLRLSYRQVMHEWDRARAGILALVARGEHRWLGAGPHPAIPA